MGEELTSWYKLHKNVETPGILSEAVKVNLSGEEGTMKGWEIVLSILCSFAMWSTCCDLIISAFFMILTHEYLLEFFFLTRRTVPKDPAYRKEYLNQGWSSYRSLLGWPPVSFAVSSTYYIILFENPDGNIWFQLFNHKIALQKLIRNCVIIFPTHNQKYPKSWMEGISCLLVLGSLKVTVEENKIAKLVLNR